MSLPQAKQDTSLHPAKGSVAEPMDKKKLEKDVDRKLKLYSAIQALRASRLPSNAQVDRLITYFQRTVDASMRSHKDLSHDTQQLFLDFNGVLESLKAEVHEKNNDELLQELVWNSREDESANIGVKVEGDLKETPVEKEKAKEDARTALQHIRTLTSLVLTNSEARKLVSDFSLVGRDLLARGASKAAQNIAPSEEELRNVDESDKSERKFVEKEALKREKEEAKAKGKDSATIAADTAGGKAGAKVDSAAQRAGTAGATAGEAAERTQTAGTLPGTQQALGDNTQTEADRVASTGADAVKSKLPETTEEEETKKRGFMDKFRSRGSDQVKRGRTFLTEEYFPKDRRDQWVWRMKKVILECQEHHEYQDSIRWLIDFAAEYSGHGRTYAGGVKDKVSVERGQGVDDIFSGVRTLLDRFANGKSVQALVIDRINVLLDDASKDEEMRAWVNDVGEYFKTCLLQQGYILEPVSSTRWNELIEQGRKFHGYRVGQHKVVDPETGKERTNVGIENIEGEGKYKPHFNALFDGVGEWVNGWTEDAANRRVSDAFSRLTKTLLFSPSTDKMEFKRKVWGDLRRVVLPGVIERVGYIPIPRIEYTDDSLDLVVENLTLSGKNLFPNVVNVEAHNYLTFSPYKGVRDGTDTARHEFIISLSQMQADMRDVAFYFKRKTGLPRIKDSGLADVVVGGEGVSVTVHVSSSTHSDSFIEVKNVSVKVANLKFSIRDSKHDFLYKTLRPLATTLIKRQIAKAVKDGIETGLKLLDGQLVAVRDRMREAGEHAEGDEVESKKGKMEVLMDTFKHNKQAVDDKASQLSRSSSQFKVVSNKRNSLLVNDGHPAGWVNRVQDKDGFRGGNGGWKCDAFDVKKGANVTAPTVA